MEIEVTPGRYVVAVSGGVDSMSLLHKLATMPDVELIVAHFYHGIRDDSAEDRKLVQSFAAERGLAFTYKNGRLGKLVSEAAARSARYGFLHETRQAYGAKAIITAHHQGDILETAIMNMLRGTYRRGLSSLGSSAGIRRPLLAVDKAAILDYAQINGVQWREDSTNSDDRFLRNYVRHRLLPRFSGEQKRQLVDLVETMRRVNDELDTQLANVLHAQTASAVIDRRWFTGLPHDVAREVLAAWLRAYDITDFGTRTIERLVVGAKTGRPGATLDVVKGWQLQLFNDRLALRKRER
jgi:tRNA(Ile)-lysidine synthase